MSLRPLGVALLVVLGAGLAAAAIGHVTQPSVAVTAPERAELTFGAVAPGATVGVNATNATASLAGALLTTTTQVWTLENANATGPYHVRLAVVGTPSLLDVATLRIEIRNATSSSLQVAGHLGALTQAGGAYVQVDGGTTARIHVTQLVGAGFAGATLPLEVYVADDPTERAYYTMRATLRLT